MDGFSPGRNLVGEQTEENAEGFCHDFVPTHLFTIRALV